MSAQLGETSDPVALVPGSRAEADSLVRTCASLSEAADQLGSRVHRLARIEDWAGEAADKYEVKIGLTQACWDALAECCRDAGRAMDGYASTLGWAQRQAETAIELWERGQALSAASAAPAVPAWTLGMRRPPAIVIRQPAVDPGQALRDQAEQVLQHARDALAGEAETAAAALRAAAALVPAHANLFSGAGNGLAGMSAGQALAMLDGLDPADLALLLKEDPTLLKRLRTASPEQVASWWKHMGSADRDWWAAHHPEVIGNLNGVPYSVRSTANLEQFRWAQAHPGSLTENQEHTVQQLTAALAAARKEGLPTQLVQFDLAGDGHGNPFVSLAYGDLDTAQKTTWLVSGMNANADNSMVTAGQSAGNLYREQRHLDPGSSHAVVAFLGYRAPDTIGEDFNASASAGAPLVAAALDGDRATRAWMGGPLPQVSVVAHSYGTTTTADALMLTRYPVSSFTMVASAGIDTGTVHSFAALHVQAVAIPGQGSTPAVYTTAAGRDHLAPLGAAISGRAEPNPQVALTPDVIGGAQSFGSNGIGALAGVDGHGEIGIPGHHTASPLLLNGDPAQGHGYFDAKTESLANIAYTTTGQPGQVRGGLTLTHAGAAYPAGTPGNRGFAH